MNYVRIFSDVFIARAREEADFWGWLTDRIPVETELIRDFERDLMTEEGLVLLTRDKLANLIKIALQSERMKTAKQLFDLTKPVQTRTEYSRKSMRIGQGEYLKLLYLKINKDSSFSNVVIDILSKPMLNYLNDLQDKFGDTLSDKFKILNDQIINWREIVPDPRSRNVEYTFIPMSQGKTELFFISTDEFIEKVVDLAKTIGYIENLPHDMFAGPDPVYIEFQEEWTSILEDQLRSGLYMEVYIDEDEPDNLSFRLFGGTVTSIDGVKLEELYQKYEEYSIESHIEKYIMYAEDIKNYLTKYEGYFNKFIKIFEEHGPLDFGFTVDISKYHIKIISKKDFEVVYNQKYYDELKEKLNLYSEEIHKDLSYYECKTFNELVEKVMIERNEVDYRLISQLFCIENANQNLGTIISVGKYLIENEIAKYPVISYYIPNDLIPLLSVILKYNDLYDMI